MSLILRIYSLFSITNFSHNSSFDSGTVLLTLPFAGAVLRSLGAPAEEVNYILAEKRREVLSGKELEKFEEEIVLAQLGVAKPEGKDDKEAAADEDGEKSESALVAEMEQASAKMTVKDDDDTSSEVKEVKSKDPEALKPLLKQVVEANISPEPKKPAVEKETEAESEEAESDSEPKMELREKEKEPL